MKNVCQKPLERSNGQINILLRRLLIVYRKNYLVDVRVEDEEEL